MGRRKPKTWAQRIKAFNNKCKNEGIIHDWRLAFEGPAKPSERRKLKVLQAKKHRAQDRKNGNAFPS